MDLLELFRLSPSDPLGDYLVEDDGRHRILWRITCETDDDAIAAAPLWWLRLPEPPTVTD